jgi:glycosyltransferase involved in cell wall biosynthesis
MLSICSPQLGLSLESNSGGEVYDREVLTRLAKKKVMVYSLLPKGRTHPQEEKLKVEFSRRHSYVPPYLFSAAALSYLVKTYQQYRFDLLRIHNLYFLGPAAVAFKKMYPRVPMIGSILHLEEGLNYLLAKKTLKYYDHLITISQSTKNELVERLHYPKSKISVAYPGVDSHYFQPALPAGRPGKKSAELTDRYDLKDKTVIMFLGGLKPRKNLKFLLSVLAKLPPKTVLVYAGTGPKLKSLQAQAKRMGLVDRVRFTGYVEEKDKLATYHLADVVVLPSLKEGFGMTLTEAGACGIATVGADHYSIKEIIKDGKTGLLATPHDVESWEKALIQLIKSQALRQKMGTAAREHVTKNFPWDKNIDTHLKVFNKFPQGQTLRNSKV